jgi:hypothetical protein
MATIEALRPGDKVCIKVPDSPIMTVLAVEGLKARCADGENLQYWFDTVMLERHEPPQKHCEMSSPEIYESVGVDALALANPNRPYSQGLLEAQPIIDRPTELPSNFWIYAEQLLRSPQKLAA